MTFQELGKTADQVHPTIARSKEIAQSLQRETSKPSFTAAAPPVEHLPPIDVDELGRVKVQNRELRSPTEAVDQALMPKTGAVDRAIRRGAGADDGVKVQGEGRLHVSFDNLPKGATTRASATGIFKEVKVARGAAYPTQGGVSNA